MFGSHALASPPRLNTPNCRALFQPMGVKRTDFHALAEIGLMRRIRSGTVYIELGNEAHNLSLIIKGCCSIEASDGEVVNFAGPFEVSFEMF
jgi:hypothetical protein